MNEMKYQKQLNLNTLEHLSQRLNISEDQIIKISANPLYWPTREVLKQNGKTREFNVPKNELKYIQKQIYDKLLKTLEMPASYHGAVHGRSSITNAAMHVSKKVVKTFDIKSFFPSVRCERVYEVFVNDLGCCPDIGRILTRLTTHNYCLPQGASTSAFLACLVFKKAEKRISNMLKGKGIAFTVYIDDICFSSNGSEINFNNLIKNILNQCGFSINMEKLNKKGVMYRHERQEVTGIVVNEKINAKKENYRDMRALLNNCLKNGVDSQKEKYFVKNKKPLSKESILGKISWIKRINLSKGQNLEMIFNQVQWN